MKSNVGIDKKRRLVSAQIALMKSNAQNGKKSSLISDQIGLIKNNAQDSGQMNIRNRFPEGWLKYIPINQPLLRFLAFKAPLSSKYFDGNDIKERFEIENVLKHVSSLRKSLALVIDLTDTDRYYDPSIWESNQVNYAKIRCPGQEVNKNQKYYQEFRTIINQFINQNGDTDTLIGVHCTHGLNRTGYLICRFLIEENGWNAEKAIESFRVSRGYPIERAKYINSLKELEGRAAKIRERRE